MTHSLVRTPGRHRAWLAAVAVLVVAGMACSGSTGGPAEITTLRVLMTDDWVTGPFVDAVRDFERDHPKVRLSVDKGAIRHMPDAVRERIKTGNPPDVVQGHAFSAASQGLAEPLDDLSPTRLTAEEYSPGAGHDVT